MERENRSSCSCPAREWGHRTPPTTRKQRRRAKRQEAQAQTEMRRWRWRGAFVSLRAGAGLGRPCTAWRGPHPATPAAAGCRGFAARCRQVSRSFSRRLVILSSGVWRLARCKAPDARRKLTLSPLRFLRGRLPQPRFARQPPQGGGRLRRDGALRTLRSLRGIRTRRARSWRGSASPVRSARRRLRRCGRRWRERTAQTNRSGAATSAASDAASAPLFHFIAETAASRPPTATVAATTATDGTRNAQSPGVPESVVQVGQRSFSALRVLERSERNTKDERTTAAIATDVRTGCPPGLRRDGVSGGAGGREGGVTELIGCFLSLRTWRTLSEGSRGLWDGDLGDRGDEGGRGFGGTGGFANSER